MSYRPSRGDYGVSQTAFDLIPVVERVSCVHGCAHAGTDAEVVEFGPGGSCGLLARLSAAEEVDEFDARGDGIHCSARTPRATPERTPA